MRSMLTRWARSTKVLFWTRSESKMPHSNSSPDIIRRTEFKVSIFPHANVSAFEKSVEMWCREWSLKSVQRWRLFDQTLCVLLTRYLFYIIVSNCLGKGRQFQTGKSDWMNDLSIKLLPGSVGRRAKTLSVALRTYFKEEIHFFSDSDKTDAIAASTLASSTVVEDLSVSSRTRLSPAPSPTRANVTRRFSESSFRARHVKQSKDSERLWMSWVTIFLLQIIAQLFSSQSTNVFIVSAPYTLSLQWAASISAAIIKPEHI